ncbi:unnamed protein product [Prunus armeniaca]|uniref:Bulb-type lectin domain-containing protein n=1 Tax=Prunus armeniaca TaxID=36596 RepID=A0A6J5TYZ1_PRUAR|nr:unnamed protein product [Prunus armeniaca]CAB4299408.1 unnamed protein product [Prunus armeniaca]
MNFALCFLLGIAFVTAEAQQMQSNISRGSSLTPTTNSSWLSSSGLYASGFYKQGNGYAVGIFLAGMPQHTMVWTANRDNPPVSSNVTLLFTSDELVLSSIAGQDWVVKSTLSASSASMLDSGGNLPTNQGTSYLMIIDVDGILRLYSKNLKQGSWSIKWESSNDKCDPFGLCGLNSYCMSIDLEAESRCLPGFESASQRNDQISGCARNLVADFCEDKNENFTYTMQELPSTVWENVPYLVLTLEDKEACKQACLEDCNCEAVLFNDESYLKQRLPLRYGRRQMTTSNIALIKGGISVNAKKWFGSF